MKKLDKIVLAIESTVLMVKDMNINKKESFKLLLNALQGFKSKDLQK